MPKLKLFRTASGFHDSYVAAPSRAAALRAWGARTDLFAMGAAEQVDDAELMKQASAKPGTVFKAKRGKPGEMEEARAAKPKPKRKPPSRAALDRAEAALATLERKQQAERAELDKQIARLERERDQLAASHDRAKAKGAAARGKAAEDYERTLAE